MKVLLSQQIFPFLLFSIALFSGHYVEAKVQEAPDGSVCFNGCNGHGNCIDYSCHCWTGYLGDDCSTTFAKEDEIVPILTAGHFNISKSNFTQVVSSNKLLLVGFSSYHCHRCIQVENAYQNISSELLTLGVPFGRADAESLKTISQDVGASDLPALVLFHKKRAHVYRGVHSAEAVVAYVRKIKEKPVKILKNVDMVNNFLNSRSSPSHSVSTMMVVGFFSEHTGIEEDEWEDFEEVARELQQNEDVYFGAVTDAKVAANFKKDKLIDRTPSLMVIGESNETRTINLNELYGDNMGIKEWVLKTSLPLVGKMTPQNFQLYDQLRIPMLLLFLDLTDEHMVSVSSEGQSLVGGKSGGLFNEVLIQELRLAAAEHVDRIAFVYLDGTLYQDQMRSLGLYGGKERLPSLAFNTRDGAQIPFPEELPINKDTILQFCADFISGKLRNAADAKDMAKRALTTTVPVNQKNRAMRKEAKKDAPEVVRGVSEQFGDGNAGDDAVTSVNLKNFDDVVMNPDKDVVLLLHSKECVTCSHFNMYYKRMAERYKELAIPSLTIAQMDVSVETPPAHLNMMVGALPILVMVPSGDKQPPWVFYSGIGKVQQLMKWVHQQVSTPFVLPNLPHLTDADKIAYKQQVREREEYLDAKREEDMKAMEAMDREREEIKKRNEGRSGDASEILSRDKIESNIDMNFDPDEVDSDEF